MKLVVTGHDAEDKSVFHHAGAPPRSSSPGSYELWSTKGPPRVPDATPADAPARIGYFAEGGETSFKIVTVPPARDRPEGQDGFELPPEIARHFDPDDPEMHTTDTIDYVVIVSGVAELELDDGRKERVQQGDCVVQRGTKHAWRVVGDEPLVLAATMIGAKRE
jgi:mannose-6-phosphate isomerase-like protein (cupin superfamily)